MFKKKILLPFMIVLALTLTACTTDTVEPDNVKPDTEPVEEKKVEEEKEETTDEVPVKDTKEEDIVAGEYGDVKIKPEEAFDTYMEKYPDTKVKKVKIDKEMGQYVYKIEGFDRDKEYEVKIDTIDGTITKDYVENDDDMDDIEITRVDVEKVMTLVDQALTEVGEDAVLEEWTIEVDDGIIELEVEIDKKGLGDLEYRYNVETGKLIEIND